MMENFTDGAADGATFWKEDDPIQHNVCSCGEFIKLVEEPSCRICKIEKRLSDLEI